MISRLLRISSFLLLMFSVTACQIELNTSLNEGEANEMMAKLLSENISVSKVNGKNGVTLMVSSKQFGEAVDVLTSHGLPRRSYSTMGDIFADDGLVASPMQEWARFNFAKSQEVSQSLSNMPGVVSADVHIASSRKESPFDEPKPPSASVLIKMQESSITSDLVPQIKQMVSYSIPDIAYERVSVMVAPVQATISRSAQLDPKEAILGILVSSEDAARIRFVGMIGAAGLTALLLMVGGGVFFLRSRKKKIEI